MARVSFEKTQERFAWRMRFGLASLAAAAFTVSKHWKVSKRLSWIRPLARRAMLILREHWTALALRFSHDMDAGIGSRQRSSIHAQMFMGSRHSASSI